MKIIFRIDDIYLDGSDFEFRLLSLFQKCSIPLTLAVIPFDKQGKPIVQVLDNHIDQLLKSGNFEIALHGFSHKKNSLYSEFRDIPFEDQQAWIEKGKIHLEQLTGLKVTTFVPPWNSADENTMHAVSCTGISLISADIQLFKSLSNITGIRNIPYSVEHLYFFSTIFFRCLSFCSKLPFFKDIVLVILFHPYNIIEWKTDGAYFSGFKKRFGISFTHLESLLSRLSRIRQLKFMTLSQVDYSLALSKYALIGKLYQLLYRRPLHLLSTSLGEVTFNKIP